jgi:hypothetical protein
MPEVIVQSKTEAPPPAPTRLVIPLEDAAREIQNQIKIAAAIRGQRIRNRWELDHARSEKQEWVGRTTELLIHLFGNSEVADECNDWVATILPEYAELDLFIELFVNEMKHRIERLRSVLKRLPEYVSVAASGQSPQDGSTQQSPLMLETPQLPPTASATAPAATIAPSLIEQASTHAPVTARASRPSAHAAAAPVAQTVGGVLLVRNADEQTVKRIADFVAKLGFSLDVIDRAKSGKPLMEELAALSAPRFALLYSGETPGGESSAGANPAGESPAARFFELGCCAGAMGAAAVCVLCSGAEQPGADSFGIAHVSVDPADAWQLHLARHLRRAGLPIDLNMLA